MGHYSFKKRKKKAFDPASPGRCGCSYSGEVGREGAEATGPGGNQDDACVRQVVKDRVGSGGKQ